MEYYAERFREAPLKTFTKLLTVQIPDKDSGVKEQTYYLLGGQPEDEALRKNLHSRRLVRLLKFEGQKSQI